MTDNPIRNQLDLQSQRLGVIADRTLRIENQVDRLTRDIGTLKSILRSMERGCDQ